MPPDWRLRLWNRSEWAATARPPPPQKYQRLCGMWGGPVQLPEPSHSEKGTEKKAALFVNVGENSGNVLGCEKPAPFPPGQRFKTMK